LLLEESQTQEHKKFIVLYCLFYFQGRVVDTPEVARAKAAHLAAYNHIASATPVAYDHSQIYKPPTYSHDGYYDGDSSNSLSHYDSYNDY